MSTNVNDARPDVAGVVRAALARRASEVGALLPVLHDVQDALGYVPAGAVPAIAEALDLSRAEVHGVISYYHDFRAEPGPPHALRVCRGEACQAMGGEALLEHARVHLSCGLDDASGDVSGDGRFSVTPVYCLGLCASSPALMLDGAAHARMTPGRLDALLDRVDDLVTDVEAQP